MQLHNEMLKILYGCAAHCQTIPCIAHQCTPTTELFQECSNMGSGEVDLRSSYAYTAERF